MNDYSSLESRLGAALRRIEKGSAQLAEQSQDTGAAEEFEALQLKLADEQLVNAQLAERVKALSKRQDTVSGKMDQKLAAQKDQLAGLDAELQALRASQSDLAEAASALREAAMEGVADAEAVNRALVAELDALKALRSAEAAEVAAILAELMPIVEGK